MNTTPTKASIASRALTVRGRQKSVTLGTDLQRERILKAAEGLFAIHGYVNTTLELIVAKLGVSKPFLYYYFRDKQEIFETLSWKPTVDCFTVLDFPEDDTRAAHIKVAEGLEQLIRATVNNYPAAFFAYQYPQAFRPEMLAAQKKIANCFYDRLCTLLEEARDTGMVCFTETKITALAACSIPGFMSHWYRPDGRLGTEDMVKELTYLAWRVIGLRRSRRPSPQTPSKSLPKKGSKTSGRPS